MITFDHEEDGSDVASTQVAVGICSNENSKSCKDWEALRTISCHTVGEGGLRKSGLMAPVLL